MCMFTDKVDKVSDTNIFGALVGPYTQLTVYTNKVAVANSRPQNSPTMFNGNMINGMYNNNKSHMSPYAPVTDYAGGYLPVNHNIFWEQQTHWSAIDPTGMQLYDRQGEPVAMVLAVPLPNGDAKSIKMVNMSECKDFFTNLRDTFLDEDMSFSVSYGAKTQKLSRNGSPLQVKRCGPYSYSIVPDVDSFIRLKQKVFKFNPRIFEVMKKHYPKGYAFLVCIIDKSAQYSPIAYLHPSDGKNIFIPTMHEHGHAGEEIETDDWDHEIYTIDRDNGTRLTDKRTIRADISQSVMIPTLFNFPYKHLNWKNLKRRTVSGLNPNGDILIRA